MEILCPSQHGYRNYIAIQKTKLYSYLFGYSLIQNDGLACIFIGGPNQKKKPCFISVHHQGVWPCYLTHWMHARPLVLEFSQNRCLIKWLINYTLIHEQPFIRIPLLCFLHLDTIRMQVIYCVYFGTWPMPVCLDLINQRACKGLKTLKLGFFFYPLATIARSLDLEFRELEEKLGEVFAKGKEQIIQCREYVIRPSTKERHKVYCEVREEGT